VKLVPLAGACLLCCGLVGVGVLAGCDRDVALPDRLSGTAVARMAERELEAQNPRLAAGTLACPVLALRIGASVRCHRTTELSDGRVVRVAGTVKVTSLAGGGRLHVAMDDQAEEFGLSADRVAAGVGQRYTRRFHRQPGRVTCPYLRGAVGATVACRIDAPGGRRAAEVRVTGVDPAAYRTTYEVRWGRPPS